MSYYNRRTWVCDRCGKQTETELTEQPPHWLTVRAYSPPLAAEELKEMTLCGDCTNSVLGFMATASVRVQT